MWGQPLSGSLWLALLLSLAPSCSLLLSQAPYCSPNLRTTSSLGSQGPCSARSGAAALQHFLLLCLQVCSCMVLEITNKSTPDERLFCDSRGKTKCIFLVTEGERGTQRVWKVDNCCLSSDHLTDLNWPPYGPDHQYLGPFSFSCFSLETDLSGSSACLIWPPFGPPNFLSTF